MISLHFVYKNMKSKIKMLEVYLGSRSSDWLSGRIFMTVLAVVPAIVKNLLTMETVAVTRCLRNAVVVVTNTNINFPNN